MIHTTFRRSSSEFARIRIIVRHLANLFWEDIFEYNELVLAGGDVNGGIQAFREVAIARAEARGWDLPSIQAHVGDSIWLFILFPPGRRKQFDIKSSDAAQLSARDLRLRRNDGDAHYPLLTHIRNLEEPRRKSRRMPNIASSSSSTAGPLPVGLAARGSAQPSHPPA